MGTDGIYRRLFGQSPAALIAVAQDGTIRAMNAAAAELVGPMPEGPAPHLTDVLSDYGTDRLMDRVRLSFGTSGKIATATEIAVGQLQGVRRRIDLHRVPGDAEMGAGGSAKGDDADPLVLIHIHPEGASAFREHTDLVRRLNTELSRQRALSLRLEKALTRSDYLHRELIHRVKNNLAILGSLIRLRARDLGDGVARRELDAVALRIQSMALVHQLLDRTSRLEIVDAAELIDDLCGLLSDGLVPDGVDLVWTVSEDGVELHVEDAIALGLLINELVSNALKHAFPEGRTGSISIDLTREAGDVMTLRVADDGAGGAVPISAGAKSGHGLEILHALADRMGGTLKIDTGAGTAWSLRFTPRVPQELAAE